MKKLFWMFAITTMATVTSMTVMGSNSYADALYVECGKSVDTDNWQVLESVIAISGEDLSDFSGPVGGTWTLDLNGKEVPANTKGISVKAKVSGDGIHVESITVRIVRAQSASGPVGTEYIIYRPYSSEDVIHAEKYNIGGFVGRLKVADYSCLSASA